MHPRRSVRTRCSGSVVRWREGLLEGDRNRVHHALHCAPPPGSTITRSSARSSALQYKKGMLTVVSKLKEADPGCPDGENVDVVSWEAVSGDERRVHRAVFLQDGFDSSQLQLKLLQIR